MDTVGTRKSLATVIIATQIASLAFGADLSQPVHLLPANDLNSFSVWTRGHGPSDPDHLFTISNNMLRVSGQGQGYVSTKEDYSNYRLIIEYKWGGTEELRQSAVFVHATDLGKHGFLIPFKCRFGFHQCQWPNFHPRIRRAIGSRRSNVRENSQGIANPTEDKPGASNWRVE
jgi:hypothetical protein